MSGEYEFNPPLKYDFIITHMPPSIKLVDGYGDECELSVTESSEKGVKGGRLYVRGIRHRLMTDGTSSAWLREMPNGDARVEVFGLQTRGGGFGWWAKAFLEHLETLVDSEYELEIYDMCNGGPNNHPPDHGYCVSELPGSSW